MKIHVIVIATIVITILSITPNAQAQTCTSPIIGWTGTYSVSGSGSGTGQNYAWSTINENETNTVNAQGGALSCTQAIWYGRYGQATTPSGSVNDQGTSLAPCPNPLKSIVFSGSALEDNTKINIDLSSNTYYFLPYAFANLLQTYTACDGTVTTLGPASYAVGPLNWVFPTLAPPTFPLPATVQPLSGNMSNFNGLWGFDSVTIPWNFSFNVTPVIDDADDPCKTNGGSSIGCQNQSLGEDVPITGTGFSLHYESSRMPGSATGNSPAGSAAVANGGWNCNVNHVFDPAAQKLYLGDGSQRSQWQLGTPLTLDTHTVTAAGIDLGGNGYVAGDILTVVQTGASGGTLKVLAVNAGAILTLAVQTPGTGYSSAYGLKVTGGTGTGATVNIITINYLLSSEDGSEVYVFAPSGAHLKTVKPLTGALKYLFTYNASNRLIAITDGSGNKTSINRAANGSPTSIVSPYAQETTLSVDANGFLSQITNPSGDFQSFVYTTGGLMTSRKDANGNPYSYTYDGAGRLTKDADSAGGSTTLSRTKNLSGGTLTSTVSEVTAMGITSTYQSVRKVSWADDGSSYSETRTNTWPGGLQATSSTGRQNGQISENFALPTGMKASTTLGSDPVWGLQRPVATSETLTQGNLTMNNTGKRTVTLGTIGNPFSVTTQADTGTVNGRSFTSTYTALTHSRVNTSPVGRTLTIAFDSLERVSSTQIEGLTATTFAYDSHGRLASTTQGTRKTTFGYNSQGFLATLTDPFLLKTSFGYDVDGHLTATTLPDRRIIHYTYDGNGNLTSVTPPGKSAHAFAYNEVNLPDTYTPPAVTGTGPTTYAYDLDRNLTNITRPDGEHIKYGYDTAGRMDTVITPTGTTTFTYNSTTGNLASAANSTEHIAYSYNGPLPSQSTWTGTISGSVARAYNNNFWITGLTINGTNSVAFQHDNDGLVTKAGLLSITRNSKNGLITSTTLGVTTDTRTYNGFGELIGCTASISSVPAYSVQLTRDADGRVTAKTETIAGVANSYSYSYDLAGRLIKATKNTTMHTYTYDTNSNRLSAVTSTGTASGTYDAQDRMLTYGTASYTYTANGELTSRTAGIQKTSYTYDVLGNLTAVTLPSGTKINYLVDAENHRVGKQVNGAVQAGFLYDRDAVVAQLNGSNQLVSQFVYGTGSASPDYMVRGGVTYRIFSDILGSPVLVVNTVTGAVAEQITYDEFGNVISDTNPGFQPFGFAGGLSDQDTKLVRFGARDYDPSVGRWTTTDPILFRGGETNLYGYVHSDPVNFIDPQGTDDADPSGGGVPDGGVPETRLEKCKKWVYKLVDRLRPHKVPTPIGVNVNIDKPEFSVGTEVGLEVEGHKVATAGGQAAVGLNADGGVTDNLFYVDVNGEVKVGPVTVVEGRYHAEGGNPTHLQAAQDLISHTKDPAANICDDHQCSQ